MWGAGAHLMGRVTYEEMAAFWPTSTSDYARPMNEIPKVVFSKTLKQAGWAETRIVGGDLREEIGRLSVNRGTTSSPTGAPSAADCSRATSRTPWPAQCGRCPPTIHGMARTDRASRVIAAPPDQVYAALLRPEAL